MLGFYFCFCQAKQKQALLESNLPGIHLMTDEKVKRKEFALGLLFTFSDVFMPYPFYQLHPIKFSYPAVGGL
jgi:hypothetical protein